MSRDYKGQTIGNLTVIKTTRRLTKSKAGGEGHIRWECQCVCGATSILTSTELTNKRSRRQVYVCDKCGRSWKDEKLANSSSVLVKLPDQFKIRLDQTVASLGMTRSEFIRTSIEKEIERNENKFLLLYMISAVRSVTPSGQ